MSFFSNELINSLTNAIHYRNADIFLGEILTSFLNQTVQFVVKEIKEKLPRKLTHIFSPLQFFSSVLCLSLMSKTEDIQINTQLVRISESMTF